VHVESTQLARVRGLSLSPTAFRRIALASALMLWLIVGSGAAVRLTGSGLGCQHWPGCTAGDPFPSNGYHSFIEFSNRVVAFITIVATLIAWLAARRTPGLLRGARVLALWVFLGTLAQAPLGLITVKLHLHPLIVMTHLLLSAVVLAGGVVLLVEALRLELGSVPPFVPLRLRRIGLVFAGAAAVLLVSGTFATAAGPHSGGEHVRRFGSFGPALQTHAYIVAVFTAAFVWLLAALASRRERSPRLFRLSLILAGLLAVQILIGEVQYRTHLPWGLVLVHVLLAAGVWALIVGIVTLLYRPIAWLRPRE
jgi:cytochrome c oxidase assembly protein subunit 15